MISLLGILIAAAPVQSFAVVIGENRPADDTTAVLSFADDDAVMTHHLLVDAGAQSTLLVELDKDSALLFPRLPAEVRPPTLNSVKAALTATFAKIEAARRLGHKTRFYFVYSGHGDVADGEGYIALHRDKLSRSFLRTEVLARSPADENHVIIDACRSYFMVFDKGPGGSRRRYERSLPDMRQRFRNTGFILSTSSDRDSHEWARFRGGIFSHEVRSGLRGGADADLDGRITYRELGAFIDTANRALSDSRFRPDAVLIPPERAFEAGTLLEWGPSDILRVPQDASLGHMVLEDARGVRLADAHPASTQQLLLRAPARRPLFLRSFDGSTEYIITQAGSITLEHGAATKPSVVARGPAHLAFRLLFSTAFSNTSVVSFDEFRLEQSLSAPALTQPSLAETVGIATPWLSVSATIAGAALTAAAVASRNTGTENAGSSSIYGKGAMVAYSSAVLSAAVWLVIELQKE